MSTLREEVDQWVGHALDYGHQEAREEAVATTLARFREAMLSEKVVAATSESIYGPDDPYHIVPGSYRTREHLTAALDAALGESQ